MFSYWLAADVRLQTAFLTTILTLFTVAKATFGSLLVNI